MKQIIKIYTKNQDYDEALKYLHELMKLLPKVNKNYGEESTNKIINNYSTINNKEFINNLYEIVLNSLIDGEVNSDKLWIKINLNKLQLNLTNKEYESAYKLIQILNVKLDDSSEVIRKSYTLELISLEIEYEFHKAAPKISKLNKLYKKSLTVTTAVTHPKIIGIIKECIGKIQFYRGNYEQARLEFYECFKNYDEAGYILKKKILKYVVLCSILTENEFNPFESQDTNIYSNQPEYFNYINLIKAYDELDLNEFIRIHQTLMKNDDIINDDIFTKSLQQILLNLRLKLILNYLKCYKCIKFQFFYDKFNISSVEFEEILLILLNYGKISNVRIDFTNNFIQTDIVDDFLPLDIDSKDIYYNLKVLKCFNANQSDDLKKIDENFGRFTSFSQHLDNINESLDQYNSTQQNMDNSYEMAAQSSSTSSQNIKGNQSPVSGQFASNLNQSPYKRPEDFLKSLIFLIENPANKISWYKQFEDLFESIKSSIPSPVKSELSQKDQIYSKQRNENILNANVQVTNQPNDLINFNSFSTNPDENQTSNDDSEYSREIHKFDLLSIWQKEINDNYIRLAGNL